MRRPRHLSPEERELWDRVARQARPIKETRQASPIKKTRQAHPIQDAGPVHKATETRTEPAKPPLMPDPLPDFRLGQKVDHSRGNDLLPGLAEQMGRAPVRMDAKAHGKLKRGKLVPEARIDLHGMTLAEAHPALTGFILSSHARGLRLVLVITGKGREKDYEAPMPVRHGVLRHQVPHWLRLAPLAPLVLQIAPAHIRHGGGGAYYVYLRRAR